MAIARTIEGKVIKTQIKGIGARAATLEKDIHACAVNCIGHALKCGDFTMLSQLVATIGVVRTNAVKAWAEKNGGAMWKAGKEGKPGQFGKDLEKFEALTAEGIDKVMDRLAKLNPFDEHKEPEYNGLDVMKLALSIITRAEKLKADADAGDEAAKIKLSKSNLKGLEVLKHALKTVNPDKVEEIAA